MGLIFDAIDFLRSGKESTHGRHRHMYRHDVDGVVFYSFFLSLLHTYVPTPLISIHILYLGVCFFTPVVVGPWCSISVVRCAQISDL